MEPDINPNHFWMLPSTAVGTCLVAGFLLALQQLVFSIGAIALLAAQVASLWAMLAIVLGAKQEKLAGSAELTDNK